MSNIRRSRQLSKVGREHREAHEAAILLKVYLASCEEVGADPDGDILATGENIRAELARIQKVIDRIKNNLPTQERDFLRFYYFEGCTLSETCQKIGVTNAQGQEIRRDALQHFDEVETEHEQNLFEKLREETQTND